MKLSDIPLRDPYVLADAATRRYYLYGTGPVPSGKPGFGVYISDDLERWEGPLTAFEARSGFWGDRDYWAPEVHPWQGRYCMFATFKAEGRCRGTALLVADRPEGPFEPASADGTLTPRDWECLDGTLYVDAAGEPWLVFCREWLEVVDGEVYAVRLSADLTRTIGEPRLLFRASEAPWVRPLRDEGHGIRDGRITDGPFMHRLPGGKLAMLWSSFGEGGDTYTMGLAVSDGGIEGPWLQLETPVFRQDGGHGMLFRTFAGDLIMTIHSPNRSPLERPAFFPVAESADDLRADL